MSEELKSETKASRVKHSDGPSSSSAGIIILQWLTYAFWGWTILSLVWLSYIVLANFFTDHNTADMVPYAIAATLVLLPLSFVCDIFYGRHEPSKKVGAAMVVMVIHAVIFALFGIGMLISAVLTLVQMMIGTSGNVDNQTVWLGTALISALIYALTFLRTLNPSPKLRMPKIYPAVMAVIVGVFIVLGFVGPVAQASLTRDDRDIERSIDNVSQGVERYVTKNKKLPNSLSDTALRGEAKSLVDRGLVTYKKGDKVEPVSSTTKRPLPANAENDSEIKTLPARVRSEYRYELCTTYKKADDNRASAYVYDLDDEYRVSPNTYGHPAGDVCYKLKVTTYNE